MNIELPIWMFWLLFSLVVFNMVLSIILRRTNDALIAEYRKNGEVTKKLIDRLIAYIRKEPDPDDDS